MRVVTILFVLLLLSVAAVEAATVEGCVVPAGVTASRPDPDGVPTRVAVGVYMIDLRKLNDSEQSFEADFILVLIWKDQRLAGLDSDSSLVGCAVDLKDIWDPHAVILNDRSLVGQFEAPVRIEEGGVIR
ncbi:MAG: hypothetical protein WBG96_10795, partial [Thermoanaerobaculia bacterium]